MKSLKRILQLVIVACALLACCMGASAKTNSMIDQAHILTAKQRTDIAQMLDRMEKKHNVRMAVITVPSIKGNDLAKYTNNVLDKNYTEGKNGNMLLLLDMQKKNLHISTDQKMLKRIPSATGVQTIKNDITPLLKKGNYAQAFTKYATRSDELLSYYEKNGKPYGSSTAATTTQKPKEEKKGGFSIIAFLGALCTGGLGAFGYGSSLKKSMSNVAQATEADEYLQRDTFELTGSDDSYLYTTVAVVPHGSRQDEEIETDHGDDYHGGDSDSFGDEGSDYDTYDSDSDDGGSFDDSFDDSSSDDD